MSCAHSHSNYLRQRIVVKRNPVFPGIDLSWGITPWAQAYQAIAKPSVESLAAKNLHKPGLIIIGGKRAGLCWYRSWIQWRCSWDDRWAEECKKLRILASNDFAFAIGLMVPILSNDNIHLTSLKYEGASLLDTQKFFPALANQTSLVFLYLEQPVKNGMQAIDVMVKYLSKLINLTDLYVRVSDFRWIRRPEHCAACPQSAKARKTKSLVVIDNWRLSHWRYLACGCVSEITAENRT